MKINLNKIILLFYYALNLSIVIELFLVSKKIIYDWWLILELLLIKFALKTFFNNLDIIGIIFF